ncbi:MAG TPA: DUF3107 domain-containing protein [Acidimicrobiia bacterium]|jgi:hypothetical protein|nr:DUF3107 domain-containing protein [Acidimicrobiia bacterium]
MDVKIGVVYTPKELILELPGAAEDVRATIDGAVSAKQPIVWLTDSKGRRVGVPTDKIAYVEIGSDDSTPKIGFGR